MADTVIIYDTTEVAVPASQNDLARDNTGFTNPNLHRRIHPVNGLPLEYITAIGLTWAQANELGLTWRNSAGEYKDFYNSDYILTLVKPSNWDSKYFTYYTRSGSGTEEDPYIYTLVQQNTASWNELASQTWNELLPRTWNNLADRPQWVADTYYKCDLPVINMPATDPGTITININYPIVVSELPENPIPGKIYLYNGVYYSHKVDEYGDLCWTAVQSDNSSSLTDEGVGVKPITISAINKRKNKKYAPSEYILHIQNRDSFRHKSDTYTSPNEDMDNAHIEIP